MDRREVGRGGQEVHHCIEESADSLVAERCPGEHRDQLARHRGLPQGRRDFLDRRLLPGEELPQEVIIYLRCPFQESIARRLHLFEEACRHRPDLDLRPPAPSR